MYMTCHGIYRTWINGNEIDEWVMAPGFTQYNYHLNVQTYDIRRYLKEGQNEILVLLGDGWYRGSIDNERNLNSFGYDVALLAELHINDNCILCTDNNWMATSEGPLGLNDLQLGEHYDASKLLALAHWHSVSQAVFDTGNLCGSDCPPVKENERLTAKLLITPNGEKVLDFGQNIAGYVEMDFSATEGQTLILTHGETLDKDGNFTQKNILAPTKPAAYQQIFYTAKNGENHYRPMTCFFGFRYVKVETSMEILPNYFTAIAVYSDMETTAEFECSNEKVNQLFSNALWSMKGNFLSVMTDCPTRERSGYTGDAQVFCHTGMYLMDCMPVYDHWLNSLAHAFFPDGGMRMFSPNMHEKGTMDSSHGWCDAIVIIPYLLWKRTGDVSYIQNHYESSKKWVDFALQRAASGNHRAAKRLPKELQPYFADQGFTFGEWLEAGHSNTFITMVDMAKHMIHGEPEVSTAYLSYSCRILSEMAEELSYKKDAEKYKECSKKSKDAYLYAYSENGLIPESRRQCLYIRPVALGLLDESQSTDAAAKLAVNIAANQDHLNTGFLTTPYINRVLSDYGQTKKAYDLLLQETAPSWLYEVDKGATTIWENWNGIHADGKVEGSFNHYSLGSIAGWLIDSVCGIQIECGVITIVPKPDERLSYAKGSYLSPNGLIRSDWCYKNGTIVFSGEIPSGTQARFRFPDGMTINLKPGKFELSNAEKGKGNAC